jgi:alpha-1,2-mannosyltransferase
MLPKPTTSGAKYHGRFDKADFIYIARDYEYPSVSSNAVLDGTPSDASLSATDSAEHRPRKDLFKLFAVVFVLSSALDVAMWLIGHNFTHTQYPSALGSTKYWAMSWLSGNANGDSWDAMRAALSWVRDHPHGRLYDRVFFADKVKFQYPPSSLFIFQLMSAAGLDTTNLSMNRINFWFIAANALATGAFTFSIARRSPYYVAERWRFAVIGGIGALLFFPLMRAFSLGQVQVWINTLFALSALSYLSGRKRLAGILIGVICLLKPQFSMFIVWGLLRREWRFLTGCSIVLALGVATSLAVFGLQNHLDYRSVLRALSRSGESFLANQSFNGLLNRLYSVDDPMIWQPNRFPPFNPVVYTGTLVTSALLIGGCLLLPLLGRGVSSLFDFLAAALTFTIASPIAWEHHYGILPVVYVATLFLLLNQEGSTRRSVQLVMLTASFLITAHWFGGSWMLFGALALLGLIYWIALLKRSSYCAEKCVGQIVENPDACVERP